MTHSMSTLQSRGTIHKDISLEVLIDLVQMVTKCGWNENGQYLFQKNLCL